MVFSFSGVSSHMPLQAPRDRTSPRLLVLLRLLSKSNIHVQIFGKSLELYRLVILYFFGETPLLGSKHRHLPSLPVCWFARTSTISTIYSLYIFGSGIKTPPPPFSPVCWFARTSTILYFVSRTTSTRILGPVYIIQNGDFPDFDPEIATNSTSRSAKFRSPTYINRALYQYTYIRTCIHTWTSRRRHQESQYK